MEALSLSGIGCVSYAQLRRILMTYDYKEFHDINRNFWHRTPAKKGEQWYAIDGKELRGSIDKSSGETRGEAIVLSANHETRDSELVDFYSGKKESEKTVITNYMSIHNDLKNRYFTLDALHCSSNLLGIIEGKSGGYLVQVKGNQKHLLEDLKETEKWGCLLAEINESEKGHGRITTRQAMTYAIDLATLDKKWRKSGMSHLIVMERHSVNTKTKIESKETSYYISNVRDSEERELYDAIRNHWQVEVGNNIRDTNFGEDKLISYNPILQRGIATILTIALNPIQQYAPNSKIKNYREELAAEWDKTMGIFENRIL